MPSINIQFHMLFEELVEFVADIRSRLNLEVEVERFFPKAILKLSPDADLGKQLTQFGQVNCFWFVHRTPGSKKAERLMLGFGGQRGNRLAQSQLGAGTRKRQTYEVLKEIASALKKRTMAGIWIITEAGNVGYDKNFRISEGAANACRSGKIELVSPVFTQSFRVDPPESDEF